MRAPTAFKDHFSGQSEAYQRFRPDYPLELFSWLVGHAPGRRLAVDVATGNGQAAVALARHFESVIATEASAAQLGAARPHPRVTYRLEPAEASSVASGSADLLVSAQAAHWFDWALFVAEAARVLRPAGLFAIWCYGRSEISPEVDRLLDAFTRDVVGPYWPRERRHVDESYRDLVPPFPPVEAPVFAMQADWNLESMLGYLDTWSAVRRHRSRTGRDPLAQLAAPLAAVWGGGLRRVGWPLTIKAGRA